jgi:SAM-dependent methyltransferase
VLLLYSLTIFVGAGLLFLVQPLFARMVLPLLGGSPGVWNTAMVFYQGALLAGYAWTHFTTQKLGARKQAWLHLAVLLIPLALLPLAIPAGWKPPTQSSPVGALLLLLLGVAGLPFFAVSTTSPTLQRWFASSGHPAAKDPYFLYAASNAGSMLSLLAYPFILEPRLRLLDQSRLWQGGYIALVVLSALCAIALWRTADGSPDADEATQDASARETLITVQPITWRRRVHWIALALVPSSMMVGVTTYMSNEIAAFPLLWIVPLVLYLLTFIIVFAQRTIPAMIAPRAFAMLVLPLTIAITVGIMRPMPLMMGLHLLVLFLAALACHGELARDRPAPIHLTEFYLWMSLGGVLGGAFNALLAPVVFKTIAEYPLALVAACALLSPTLLRTSANGVSANGLETTVPRDLSYDRVKPADFLAPVLLGLLTMTLISLCRRIGLQNNLTGVAAMYVVPLVLCFSFSRRSLRFALGVGALFLSGLWFHGGQEKQVLRTERSFFGMHRVAIEPSGRFRNLMHGNTTHGAESLEPGRQAEPISYYYRTGPAGQIFETFGPRFHQVGAVGLGVGALASYGLPGQKWTYYEIDPDVKDIALNDFTFLRNCRAEMDIVLGDARLSLQSSPNKFDILVLDAYSSDAIPVHLMTREAIRIYLDQLAPGGLLVFHISNRHLKLAPVLGNLARDAGLIGLHRLDKKVSKTEQELGKAASQWAIMVRRRADLGSLATDKEWIPMQTNEQPVWTDDYSSILSAMTWK